MNIRVIPEGAVSPLQMVSVILIIALVVGVYYLSTQVSLTGNVISKNTGELAACQDKLTDCGIASAAFENQLSFTASQLDTCNSGYSTCKESLGITSGSEQSCRTDLNSCVVQRDSLEQDYTLCSSSLNSCTTESETLAVNYNALADSFAKFKCCTSPENSGLKGAPYYIISGNNVVICTDAEGSSTRPTGC